MTYQGSVLLNKSHSELASLLQSKVLTFQWDGIQYTALCHEVMQEGTIVVTFRVWYQHPREGGGGGSDPYSHSARLSPRLSEMTDIEIHDGAVPVGGFIINPKVAAAT